MKRVSQKEKQTKQDIILRVAFERGVLAGKKEAKREMRELLEIKECNCPTCLED